MDRVEIAEWALAIAIAIALLSGTLLPTAQWWGVMFQPLSEGVTTEACTETMASSAVRGRDGCEIRFKSADLLRSWQQRTAK